jgi:hypothetical protein
MPGQSVVTNSIYPAAFISLHTLRLDLLRLVKCLLFCGKTNNLYERELTWRTKIGDVSSDKGREASEHFVIFPGNKGLNTIWFGKNGPEIGWAITVESWQEYTTLPTSVRISIFS